MDVRDVFDRWRQAAAPADPRAGSPRAVAEVLRAVAASRRRGGRPVAVADAPVSSGTNDGLGG